MLISQKTSETLAKRIIHSRETWISGLCRSAKWFVANQAAPSGMNLIILPDEESAEYCTSDIYTMESGDNVFFLPVSGKSTQKDNYRTSLTVQRTAALGKIVDSNASGKTFIVTYPQALSEPTVTRVKLGNISLKIVKGEEISFDSIKNFLFENGFEKVDFVSLPGQFATRGAIIDIFSYSYNLPYRLSFFGDEVEHIRSFDCNTQLTREEFDAVDIFPDISQGEQIETSIISLLPKDTTLWLDSAELYEKEPFYQEIAAFNKVYLNIPACGAPQSETIFFNTQPQPVFNKNFELLSADIYTKMDNSFKVYIFGEKRSQLDRLKSILSQEHLVLPEFVEGKNIHEGFIDLDSKICCYTDHEIFDRFHRVRIRRTVEKSEQLALNDISAFNIGDYIVHIDHGVGVFGGLVRLKDDKGRMHEVVKLMYKDGDVIFESVHAINKISLFRSKDGEAPKINKLGSKMWASLKAGAKSKVKDIAKELIQLYAKRKSSKGHAFPADNYLQEELESSFMYEDTPDQEKATADVKRDMEDTSPMDRLICGDVGFGKTEIAIRAAFKAACDSKQVAVLVPTTILSLQHYNTFKNRLQNFPVTVEYVSRLRSAKEITDIKKRLKEGKIDILIGTHKILGSGFEFKDLGLLVIDEEQKFGVSAKERLRQLKSNVDTLTLTATPIPRTLQFSLLGARDLSIISTPPPNRIPVQTEIMTFNEGEIKEIINYELKRGGQIFFLHNRVEEIEGIGVILQRLVPDMKICIAHGKMESKVLEDKMMAFMRGDYDMLLCTTIIESGLDIPNTNTIIINQAQNIGLSDLHQLRGRVGRSNRKAFCYLVVPPLSSVTDEARRRLKAITEFTDLGSGFNIAMQDLDIRGAGNLLGAEQSGFMSEMGYETYQKVLSEAMEELGVEIGEDLTSRSDKFSVDCTVETDQLALIPDSYLDVTAEKIRIYKQLDSIVNEKEIYEYGKRLVDRFGPMPQEVENLFEVVKIKNLAAKAGFEKVIIKNGMEILFFVSNKMSPYYDSKTFKTVIDNVNKAGMKFVIKQNEGRVRIVTKNVDTLAKAYDNISYLLS